MAHGEVTVLLQAYRGGDRKALDDLLPIVYEDLRRIARAHVRKGPRAHTLNTMTLVHEAYLRLVDQNQANYEDRQHFLSVCARAMRQIVISNARKHSAAKRGGDAVRATFNEEFVASPGRSDWLLALDEALVRLSVHNERMARVVECRYFAGYTEQETADALKSSLRTVQRDWTRARAWLKQELGPEPGE
ncbi:MAG: sigma-70 family RNA polymerase sigma factor [Gemmatimonadetes bacterium]|nr:sigma-70 family RNA polymerase sigma factor [Gemmatimonadota bacterium]